MIGWPATRPLVTSLAWAHFQGAEYDYFAQELAKYGLAVISGWMRRGLIFARYRDRGFGGLPEPPVGAFDDPDVVEELANETVAKALHHFRSDVLMTNKWDYRRGASLRTFSSRSSIAPMPQDPRSAWSTSPRSSARWTPSATRACARRSCCTAPAWSHDEIGHRLGVPAKTIERMIANERDRMRRRGIA